MKQAILQVSLRKARTPRASALQLSAAVEDFADLTAIPPLMAIVPVGRCSEGGLAAMLVHLWNLWVASQDLDRLRSADSLGHLATAEAADLQGWPASRFHEGAVGLLPGWFADFPDSVQSMIQVV